MPTISAILGGSPALETMVPVSSCTLPDFNAVEDHYRDIFSTGMVTNWKYVREYEEQTARYLGVDHVVAVSSATAGLLLVLKCLDLEGEVILPSFTFSVTGHVLAWNNLQPVYVDIDLETCLIDPEKVHQAISPSTCAIMGVHIWGNPCAEDQLQEIADHHGIPLIFDAAQAFGSRYLEKQVGGSGRAQVFSCSPTKVVTSGEGGIVATNDEELAAKVRVGRNYGDDGSYDCAFEGINARMSELHAVLGLASLAMADENISHRHRLFNLYRQRLGQLPGIRFQKTTPGGISNGVYFSIIIDSDLFGLSRDQLYIALKHENVDTRRYYYPPLHQQRVNTRLTSLYQGKLPHTEHVSTHSLTLPMYSHLTEDLAGDICGAIERLYENRQQIALKWPEIEAGANK